MRGVKVLELAGSAAGAYCSRLFATAGADVVLVERPNGSTLRAAPPWLAPPAEGEAPRSAVHEFLHAYKRGVTLEDGDERLDVLFVWADLVISTSDGDPDAALALHERIAAANPAAVHVVLSGFGLTGRWRARRTSGLVDWASGGHLFITGEPGREPLQGGGPWNSYLHGGTAAVGAQGALFAARRTGRGDLVDVGAMESGVAGHQWSITMYTHTGVLKGRHANRMGEMHHPMGLFPCSDGWVCIGAASREQWEHLCIAMDQVELLADDALYSPADRFDRADELDELFLPWLAERTADEVVQILQEARVPAGRVLTMSEVLADAQLEARAYWATPEELGLSAKMPGVPFHVGDDLPFRAAPALGQHTDEVFAGVDAALSTSIGTEHLHRHRAAAGGGSMKPLEGVRVIEFSVAWAGPLCGRYLAELGADVIKVEHPTSRGIGMSGQAMDDSVPWEWGTLPDPQVRTGIFPHAEPGDRWWDRMGHWNKLGRGKRSLCLDAKAPGGGEVLRRLIERNDVVLNNYSPRGAVSLGLDPASVSAINPRAITVSMSGYGATGPMSTHFSWGPILEAHSGFDEATGYAGERPMRIGLAYPDAAGGVHGAFAVMAALWDRELTGEVNHIDLSQLETLCLMGGPQYLATSVSGHDPERRGNVSLSHAPQGVYRCQGDDAWVAVTVTDDAAWSGLVDLLERAVLRDPALGHVGARFAAHELIDAEISAWTATRDRFDVAAALQAVGVAASPAMTNADLVNSGQLADRNFIATWDQPGSGVMSYPGTPLHFASGGTEMVPAPTLGQHNEEILAELGFDADTMAALEADGAIRDSPPY